MAIRLVEYLRSLVRELAKLSDETEWVEFKCNNKQPQRERFKFCVNRKN